MLPHDSSYLVLSMFYELVRQRMKLRDQARSSRCILQGTVPVRTCSGPMQFSDPTVSLW